MMSGFCSTALIACFVAGGSNAFAQTAYRVTDLGVLPSKEESVPAAINGQGLVAGTSSAEASGEAASAGVRATLARHILDALVWGGRRCEAQAFRVAESAHNHVSSMRAGGHLRRDPDHSAARHFYRLVGEQFIRVEQREAVPRAVRVEAA